MQKALFTIDGFKYPHIGYTAGKRWNGWATPFFEIDEALAVMQEFNSCDPEFPMTYNKETDTFTIEEIGGFDGDEWKGINYQTEEGIKHLYGIGAYSWVWELTTEEDLKTVANRVEDFIYEFDTYEYANNLGTDREHIVEEIERQLKDFKVLKQVLVALYVEDFTEEELFNKLGEVVKL